MLLRELPSQSVGNPWNVPIVCKEALHEIAVDRDGANDVLSRRNHYQNGRTCLSEFRHSFIVGAPCINESRLK